MDIAIDATAIVSVIMRESNRRRILKAITGSRLISPPSMAWEVGNAMTTMIKAGRTTVDRAVAAFDVYDQLGISIADINIKTALKLAGQYRIHAYDAYVMQCAMQHGAVLLTQDERMLRNAKVIGIQTIEVR